MVVIGLTGGFLSGKTTVSQMLKEKGAVVIDADKVGHQAYAAGTPVWQEVVAAFGPGILKEDREIGRRKLGGIVFGDPEALKQLNRIMHPPMLQAMKEMVEGLRRDGAKVVVVEAAVLLEAHWEELVNQIWVVVAPEEVVLKRVKDLGGFTEEQVRARLRSQLSNKQRVKYADVVIDTDCSLEEVRARVEELWRGLDPDKPGPLKASFISEPPRERLRQS